MSELTLVNNSNFAAMAQAMGMGADIALPKKQNTLARLKLDHKGIMGESTVNGKKIVVIEEASDATPQLALEKAKKLVEKDKVDIVFGPLSGDEGVAIAEYSKKVPKVTFINTTSSASEATLVAKSKNFFRFHGDAAQWSGGVGEIAYKDLGILS